MSYDPIRPYGAATERLAISGAYFVQPDGTLHRRRSLTAFTLAKRVAEGRLSEARAFLDWAVAQGANEVRVFTQTNWNGTTVGVEPGWVYNESACARVCEDAAARGCYVELVAHTYAYNVVSMEDHLRRVDTLCQAHPNALLEVANEPPVNSIPLQAVLDRYQPRALWSSGQYDPTPYPTGQWINHHSDRKPEWPRCFKDAVEFGTGAGPYQPFEPPFHGPVMLDEPPQVEKTAVPEDWRAYGAGAAFFAAGATLHSFPSLQQCVIPTDATALACIRAFYAGFADVPLQRYFGYEHPDDRGSLRRYRRRGEDGAWYEISVRPYEFRRV